MTKCKIDREKAGLTKPGTVAPMFVPECDENGLFTKLQHSLNGSSWCVAPKTGEVADNTFVIVGEADCANGKKNYEIDQFKLFFHHFNHITFKNLYILNILNMFQILPMPLKYLIRSYCLVI